MWATVNDVTGTLVGSWLWPMRALPVAVQIAWLAFPLAGLALLAYRFSSNQRAIAAAKDGVVASLLELRLYRDDLPVVLGAQVRLAGHALGWFGHSLPPIGVILVPFALVLAQVEARYAWRAPAPGESVIVSALIEPSAWTAGAVLELDEGLERDTPALRVTSAHTVYWRHAPAAGRYRLVVRVGGETAVRTIAVGDEGTLLCLEARRADDPLALAYPGQALLPAASPLMAIRVDYPRGRGFFLGLSSASWLLMGLTILVAFVAQGRVGVTF